MALAATRFIENEMAQQGINANFDLGGITARIVKLHEQGLVKKVLDVQSFDGKAYAVVRKTMRWSSATRWWLWSPILRAVRWTLSTT